MGQLMFLFLRRQNPRR